MVQWVIPKNKFQVHQSTGKKIQEKRIKKLKSRMGLPCEKLAFFNSFIHFEFIELPAFLGF